MCDSLSSTLRRKHTLRGRHLGHLGRSGVALKHRGDGRVGCVRHRGVAFGAWMNRAAIYGRKDTPGRVMDIGGLTGRRPPPPKGHPPAKTTIIPADPAGPPKKSATTPPPPPPTHLPLVSPRDT